MGMWKKVKRCFTVKTRFEAFLVIYAIAVGAAERGHHYMQMMPGWAGLVMALACTSVVFVAGGKLLDAVRMEQVAAMPRPMPSPALRPRRRAFSRIRPRSRPMRRAAESR